MANSQQKRKRVTIYTDGGCLGNPGPGGYGVVLLYGKHRKELSAGYRLTTNNRMELLAAIVALEALKTPCDVQLHTDSKYLILVAGSAARWKANGWRRDPRKPQKAANVDLLKRLLDASRPHRVTYQWVKGHAEVEENERCDELATNAAKNEAVLIDEEFERQHPDAVARMNIDYQPPANLPKGKIEHVGQPCRKCGCPVEKRVPKRQRKPGQKYYYEYYLACPRCGTMYMVESAKRQN